MQRSCARFSINWDDGNNNASAISSLLAIAFYSVTPLTAGNRRGWATISLPIPIILPNPSALESVACVVPCLQSECAPLLLRREKHSRCPSGSPPGGVRERQSHSTPDARNNHSLRGSERELGDRAFHASTVCLLTNHTKLTVFTGS